MTPVIKKLEKNDALMAKALYATILQGDFPLKGKDLKTAAVLFSWLEKLPQRIDATIKPPGKLEFKEIKKSEDKNGSV